MIRGILKNYSFKEIIGRSADEYVWYILRILPGIVGIYLRYLYLKIFAAKVSGFVIVQRDVHIMNSYGLVFGKNVYINRGCNIDAYGGIHFGDCSALGPNVVLITNDHRFITKGNDYIGRSWIKRSIRIGKNTMVCANSYVNPGVTIGDNVVIAAGSSIFCDIPSNVRISSAKIHSYFDVMRHNIKYLRDI